MGKAMTYYGRRTCEFEKAARHSAAAAIIVHLANMTAATTIPDVTGSTRFR
jgi:hypothetical protein